MRPAWLAAIALAYALAACAPATELTVVGPNQPPESTGQARTLRINGAVGTPNPAPPAQVAYGTPTMIAVGGGGAQDTGRGDISLDFADTDLREVVAQILGAILHVNYTIDPAVHGTATLHTVTPLSRSQLLPTLVALLGQNGATLLQSGGIYRVVTTASAATGGLAGSGDAAGGQVLPLRYASAADLARVLQPFVGTGAKIVADPASNVLLVSGEPGERAALAGLVQAFDTDILAGQSYALLPVPEGAAKDFTASLQEAFRAQGNAGLAGIVRVVPLDRINSVLVIAPQGRYIDDARRVYALIERQRRLTVRSWHVYYLQDSNAQDAAYALQQAFTPNAVTATPSTNAGSQTAPGRGIQQASSAGSGAGIGGAGSGIGAGTSLTGGGGGLGSGASAAAAAGGAPPSQTAANPLLGGLDTSGAGGGGAGGGGGGVGGGTADINTMRIIANPQNNALLIFATQQEEETVEAMLRKIDILPLQVRIDATIAEVTLNDQLQYGTQFFFKSGGVNAILNNTAQTTPVGTVANTVLATTFPGFVIGGPGQGGAPLALQALQAVTTVHVLSSPELLVLDNQTARLQVGDLVPYLTSSSQNTAANSAVINSVNYQPTGVIMNVTPRVNNGGVVTLDISQEVSGIDTTVPITTTGIASPTFSERSVTSRVVVQSGQTIGLAGLITDNISRGNSGIPFLKDIPLLGFLTGTQNNQRTRTELLVLITPHVLYDQRDARALTEDLQQQLPNAAAVPAESQMLRASGSNDPGQSVRRALQLH
jgi:general secretion pathway protein D